MTLHEVTSYLVCLRLSGIPAPGHFPGMSDEAGAVLVDLIEERAVLPINEGNISGVRHVDSDAEQGKVCTSTPSLPTGAGRSGT